MSTAAPQTLAQVVRERMQQLGITSARGLASRAGVAPDTARLLLSGARGQNEQTIGKVADAIGLPVTVLRRAAGHQEGRLAPFTLPPEADRLNQHQRDVVLAMVRALLHTGEDPLVGDSRGGHDVTPRVSPRLVGRLRDPFSPLGTTTNDDTA